MKIKVTIFPGAAAVLKAAQIKAAKQVAEQMLTEKLDDQEIPFDVGTLQNVQTFIPPEGVSEGQPHIIHDAVQARRLYYHPEYDFDKTNNPNAKGLWWDDWLNGEKKSVLAYTSGVQHRQT
jgi:hypothetical protein